PNLDQLTGLAIQRTGAVRRPGDQLVTATDFRKLLNKRGERTGKFGVGGMCITHKFLGEMPGDKGNGSGARLRRSMRPPIIERPRAGARLSRRNFDKALTITQ